MLKHVQLSPYRTRSADTVSLNSRSMDSMKTHHQGSMRSRQDSLQKPNRALDMVSLTLTPSLSPEPLSSLLSSRSSSYCSLSDASMLDTPTTTIKVYAKCLRSDIEYKTLGITYQTTCREVVSSLLNKYRMRHRDPNLFYLTMEVTVRKVGLRTVLALDEEARPAALQSCHPRGDSKFALQMRRGGLVKIYDSVLMTGSQYKSLLIAERTTVDELIQILLNCYNSKERVEQFSLYEVCKDQEFQRKLHPDDCPLQVQQTWLRDLNFHFLVKRNTDFRRSKISWSTKEPNAPKASSSSSSSTSSSCRTEPRSSFSSSSLCSSTGSSSSEESSTRYSCCSEYDNYFCV